ncbi:MAG: L,D-transpeptidase, partial [Cyanobacteriota bacterium]
MVEFIASIVVDLSDQKLYAYNGQQQLVRTVLVSTGKPSSPTPTGFGKVLSKHPSITMRG